MPRTLTARWTLRALLLLAVVLVVHSVLAHDAKALVVGGVVALATLVLRKSIRSFIEPLADMARRLRELEHDRAALGRERAAFAREAGIAELAASVLHDVGNALDGVTSGASLAIERLDRLHVEPAQRLAALLAKHRHELPAFVAPGAPGHDVPEYVQELAEALADDRARIAEELAAVRTSAEHACEIVHAQQRNAKRVPVVESCDIDELIDEALQIASVPATIEVARAGAGVIAPVDRHLVVQILVSLVGNAVGATGSRASGRIAIDVVDLGGRFEILVTDNGMGIRPEDRERVFQSGGLHASSNSASAMAGRLELRHTEVGRGCRFALVLPKNDARAAA